MSPTFQAVPETPAHVEIWDDDMFAAAFEGAAGDLLDEYVRSAEEQTARDEIAGKVALLIASASEAGFSDEARRFNLIDQLISRLGLLCDHAHIQEVLADHLASRPHSYSHSESTEEEAEDEEKSADTESKSWFLLANRAGALILPLFDSLRKYIRTSRTIGKDVSAP